MNPINNFPNYDNSDPTNYPGGQIKDDSGIGDGTQADVNTVGDIYQFFYKLMALSGITPNDLPDNVTNGYQLIQALQAVCLVPTLTTGITWASTETIAFNASQVRQYIATGAKVITISNAGAVAGTKVTMAFHCSASSVISFATVGGQTIVVKYGTGTFGNSTNGTVEIECLGNNVYLVGYSS